MLRISGPEYIRVLTYKNITNIVLLGDEHFSTAGRCHRCNGKTKDCKEVVDFLESLKKPADIFLEAAYATTYNKKEIAEFLESIREDGFLRKVEKHFIQQMYGTHKHNSKVNMRVHFGELRVHPSLQLMRLAKHIIETQDKEKIDYALGVIFDFKSPTTFKRFADACVKSDNFAKEIEDIFGERAFLYVDKKHLTSFEDKQHIHRIRKQILKLSASSQYSIKRFHNDMCRDIMEDYHNFEYKRVRSKFMHAEHYDIDDIIVLPVSINKWTTHLMDVYMIARMLYYLEKGGSRTIACFAGSLHAFTYKMFFEKYMSKRVIQPRWECNKAFGLTAEQKKQHRCVTIPRELAIELLDN